jgi:hypothetical protein
MDASDMPTIFNRRLSFPVSFSGFLYSEDIVNILGPKLKPPRILNLLAESRPEDAEVKSEAAFQKLVASVSELPAAPRTPRTFADRGRYPEEAGQEENTREDSPSDDDEPEAEEGTIPFSTFPSSGTQPINIMKPRTPGGSIAGSINGDDAGMSISETSSSFGAIAMDVDGVSTCKYLRLSVISDDCLLFSLWVPLCCHRWVQIQSTNGDIRRLQLLVLFGQINVNVSFYFVPAQTVPNRRNLVEDRFDPYPSSSKRRAVSPSVQYLRDSHQPTNSPMSRSNGPRLPIAIPISIPQSTASSTTSSPTISNSYPSFPRGISITSSPTLRATLSMPSPILRPLGRRREEEEQREIEGAGEAVNGLNLG